MWPLHRRPFGKPELAAGGNCSGLDKLQLAWPEAAPPLCAAGHGRSVFAAACLAVSRYLATAGLFDGTQLHGTPARRDIPRRPSNLTFVAVPKLKRNTSRRPPSALSIFQVEVSGTEWAFERIREAFGQVAQDEAGSLSIVHGIMWKEHRFPAAYHRVSRRTRRGHSNRLVVVQTGVSASQAKVFKTHAALQGLCENLVNALELLAIQ